MASCPCVYCKASLAASRQRTPESYNVGQGSDSNQLLALVDNSKNTTASRESTSFSSLPPLREYRQFLTTQLHSLIGLQRRNAPLYLRNRNHRSRPRCHRRQTIPLPPRTGTIIPTPSTSATNPTLVSLQSRLPRSHPSRWLLGVHRRLPPSLSEPQPRRPRHRSLLRNRQPNLRRPHSHPLVLTTSKKTFLELDYVFTRETDGDGHN